MEKAKTQFETDLQRGGKVNRGYYNLIVSIRDLSIYTKLGIKPFRLWSLKIVKNYFGISGTPAQLLEQLQTLHKSIKNQ